jgi:hypothetical protein
MSVRNPSDEIDGRIIMLRLIADQGDGSSAAKSKFGNFYFLPNKSFPLMPSAPARIGQARNAWRRGS